MPLINTPGFYKSVADFYYQLGALLGAGVTASGALQHLFRTVRNTRIKRIVESLQESLLHGDTLSDAFKKCNDSVPDFDLALIDASEKSGKLESCFKMLSAHYQERAQSLSQFISNLAYPAFLLHFAVFIFPFAEFFTTGNALTYLGKTFGLLVPLYFCVFLIFYAIQPNRSEQWRERIEWIIEKLPLYGSAKRSLVLSRFSFALAALLNAGVTIIQALELAASASGSVILKKAVKSWYERLLSGTTTPSEEISNCVFFPDIFVSQFATGEVSGSLDDALARLHSYYREEASRKLRSALQWTGTMIFVLIALAIGIKIIMFYLNYFQQVNMELNSM